jgi:hypothetical protein
MLGAKGPDWSRTHNQILPVADPSVTNGEYEWDANAKEWVCPTNPDMTGKTMLRNPIE